MDSGLGLSQEKPYGSVLGGWNGDPSLLPRSKKLPGNLTLCPEA